MAWRPGLPAAASQAAALGQHLEEREALGQVVFHACVEPFDALLDFRVRGEQQHRRVIALAARLSQQLNPSRPASMMSCATTSKDVVSRGRGHVLAIVKEPTV